MLDYVATGIPGVNKILGEQGIPKIPQSNSLKNLYNLDNCIL